MDDPVYYIEWNPCAPGQFEHRVCHDLPQYAREATTGNLDSSTDRHQYAGSNGDTHTGATGHPYTFYHRYSNRDQNRESNCYHHRGPDEHSDADADVDRHVDSHDDSPSNSHSRDHTAHDTHRNANADYAFNSDGFTHEYAHADIDSNGHPDAHANDHSRDRTDRAGSLYCRLGSAGAK